MRDVELTRLRREVKTFLVIGICKNGFGDTSREQFWLRKLEAEIRDLPYPTGKNLNSVSVASERLAVSAFSRAK